MDHRELIAEMAYIEKLSTQERLKLARRRRMQQLKKCAASEREQQQSAGAASKREKTAHNEAQRRRRQAQGKRVMFVSSVMLLEAAARNDIEEVRELLQQGAVSPNATNEDGLTALHQCCIDDSADMLTLLLHYGADVNAADSEKWTPLHAAATCGHLHLARLLVQHGANLLAVNADGNMPYDICEDDATLDFIECEMARRGVTQSLIDSTRTVAETAMLEELRNMKQRGEALLVRDAQGATPLHIAAANGYLRVAEFLVSHNFPLELRDCDDWTPLHAAACWGHPDVLELLVQHGASLHARNRNHETPYDICEDPDLRERVLQLLTEQETKRLGDHQRRIRRGHSANTRTQSVRRTSIRDKSLTAKKEAQEEARLRILLTNTDTNAASSQAADGGSDRGDQSTPSSRANNNGVYDKREGEEQPRIGAVGHGDDALRSENGKLGLNAGTLNNFKALAGAEHRTQDDSESFLSNQLEDSSEGLVSQADAVLDATEGNKSSVTRADSAKSHSTVARSLSGVHSVLSNNNAKRKSTESDYGGAFYSSYHENRLSDDVTGESVEDAEKLSKKDNDEEEAEEVIYYDDSVNSGYSNSDLVLSHFGPSNVDMIRTLALTASGPVAGKKSSSATPTTSFPSVVSDATFNNNSETSSGLDVVKQQNQQRDVVSTDVSNDVIGQVTMTSKEENSVWDADASRPNAVGEHAFRKRDGPTHHYLRQGEERPPPGMELTNRNLYWGRTEMTSDDGLMNRVGDEVGSERDEGGGLLTNTEDSVVPLLDPQPDLIPESVRRKPPKPAKPNILLSSRGPAPAVPSPPIQITAGKFPKASPAPAASVQVFSSTVRNNSLTESTSSGAESFVLSKGTSPAHLVDQSKVGRTLSTSSSDVDPVQNGDDDGTRVFQTRPVPPPRTSSVKSNSSETVYRSGESRGCSAATSEDTLNNGKSSNHSSPNSDGHREKQSVEKQQPCETDQPDSAAYRHDVLNVSDAVSSRSATYDSQYNTYDNRHGNTNGGIDIHVTVTVKPLAPGTLADLKQQRALNRGATASCSLPGGDLGGHPLAVGTYSVGGDSLGGLTPSSTLGRKNLITAATGSDVHSGEVNKAFDNTSVSDSVATGLNSRGMASSDTASTAIAGYRPPVSPTQTPRRYHGEPSDYPTPVESKSCCVIL